MYVCMHVYIYIYKDLALNNPQGLRWHKTQPTKIYQTFNYEVDIRRGKTIYFRFYPVYWVIIKKNGFIMICLFTLSLFLYIYIYMCVCVCVCVSVWEYCWYNFLYSHLDWVNVNNQIFISKSFRTIQPGKSFFKSNFKNDFPGWIISMPR